MQVSLKVVHGTVGTFKTTKDAVWASRGAVLLLAMFFFFVSHTKHHCKFSALGRTAKMTLQVGQHPRPTLPLDVCGEGAEVRFWRPLQMESSCPQTPLYSCFGKFADG